MQTQANYTAAKQAGQSAAAADNDLRHVRKLDAYRLGREHIFQSQQSLAWFVRKHRQQLIEAGALILIAAQWHARPQLFDTYVLRVGLEAARRHSAPQ